jgi:hypothetical protein
MIENPLNHCRLLDARNHPEPPATATTYLDLNRKYPLEPL